VTIGGPTGEPVLVLHGSNGSGENMLGANFAGELFSAGQPLDAAKYFLIVPDALGAGKSSKPSNGLRMAFPKFTYEDQVQALYRLLTEHLGVKHLKLIIGQSMGGMHAWMWGEMYPDFMYVLVPMASQPVATSGRNWVLRRTLMDAIKGRSRLEQRQLHATAADLQIRRNLLQLRDGRRHPVVLPPGANAWIGRQACRAAARIQVHCRRQRLHLRL
jgi:homoserine acetyltransferase